MTPSKNRQIFLSCLVVTGVICLCLSIVSMVGAGFILVNRDGIASGGTQDSTAPETPQSIDDQMNLIEQQISELRGLEAKGPVSRNLLTPAELRQHVLDDFFKDYSEEEAQQDALVLWSFGLLERDFDLYNFYIELYSEQIAGFYDQETDEMYVVQGEAFKGPERITYAHEFVHALQDQYYDIEKGLRFNDTDCENESERCAAVSALIEGDASLTESLWFSRYANRTDQREISEFYSNFESPVFDSAPAFMKEDFIFPYQQGQEFVQSLYDKGGWEAIHEAYLQPPVSTEQILHPDQYPADSPTVVEIPDLADVLGTGWEEIDRGEMGEWYTYLILSAGLDDASNLPQSEARKAAAGWEGDTYVVLYNASQDQISLALLTTWASDRDVSEFEVSFKKWATNRFGDAVESTDNASFWQSIAGIQALYVQDGTTAWVVGADREAVALVWGQLLEP